MKNSTVVPLALACMAFMQTATAEEICVQTGGDTLPERVCWIGFSSLDELSRYLESRDPGDGSISPGGGGGGDGGGDGDSDVETFPLGEGPATSFEDLDGSCSGESSVPVDDSLGGGSFSYEICARDGDFELEYCRDNPLWGPQGCPIP